mgnify:FL=1
MIIATAGHVDHGKTSLVKALTGIDTDTLAEEKARGLTINLGYAYLPTESGKPIGFIDVPGHHRFINNMIAGASGIDRALLVVAADDGAMPQTREHLAVLGLLGVKDVDVVVTKIDRAPEDQIAAVANSVSALVSETTGADPSVFRVSNATLSGIDALRETLFNIARNRADEQTDQSAKHGFRLSIDRRFHVRGAGIVTTGTASAGQVSVGDVLHLLPRGIDVRVKEVRANDVQNETATAGQRVALCISGKVELNDIERGDLLVDSAFSETSERVDVSLKLLPELARPLKHLSPVKVHIGAKRVAAQMALIDNKASKLIPGESSKAQLIFQQPLCTTHGERFVIRDDSETDTLGGGVVLDPKGPKYGKSKPHRIQWLEALEQADMASVVTALIDQGHCIDFSKLTTFFNLRDAPPTDFTPVGCINFQTGGGCWITSKSQLAQTRTALLNAVKSRSVADMSQSQKVAKAEPATIKTEAVLATRGIAKDQLLDAAGRATHPALAEATLTILLKKGELQSAEGRIRLPVALNAPNPHDALWQSLERALQDAGLNVPVISEAKSQAGLGNLDIKLAIKRGRELHALHRLNADRFVLSGTLLTFIKVAEQIAANQSLSVVAYKNELNVGRKLAIEVLEYFDSLGFTRRDGDQRVIVNKTAIEKRLVT